MRNTTAGRSPPGGPLDRRELLALLAGLTASSALVVVAFWSATDPEVASDAEFTRARVDIERAVIQTWQRFLETLDADTFGISEGATIRFHDDDVEPARIDDDATARDLWGTRETEGHQAVDALLRDAEDHERLGRGASEAIDALLAAQDATPDRARLAETRLRLTRIAARHDRRDLVERQWTMAQAELHPSEARGAVAYLLLIAVAGADAMSDALRSAARDGLLDALEAGQLALPPDAMTLTRGRDGRLELRTPPAVDAVLDELDRAFHVSGDPRHRRYRGREAARALISRFLPDVGREPVGVSRVFLSADDALLLRRDADRDWSALLVTTSELTDAFRDAAESQGILDDGFRLDGEGDVQVVGEPIRLAESLSLRLHHADPLAWRDRVERRFAHRRIGLLVLAAFILAAAIAVTGALRRQRQLTELQSRFIANASHELRTPLASILLMAENLERGVVTSREGLARYHTSIRQEADRLHRLVDDVLDFSRLDRGGEMRLNPEEYGLDSFADRLRAAAEDRADTLGVSLRFERRDVPGVALIDADALLRAAMNLVENAFRHGGGEGVEVRVTADDALRITVRDRGPGIPADRRGDIFKPFVRLADDDVAGTGLGLTMVREIAARHGGTVDVLEPEDGEGIEFWLEVPLSPS